MTEEQKWKELDEAVAALKTIIEMPRTGTWRDKASLLTSAHRVLDLLAEMGIFAKEMANNESGNWHLTLVGRDLRIRSFYCGNFGLKPFPKAVLAAATSDELKEWRQTNAESLS
jgi:hypothetical protein